MLWSQTTIPDKPSTLVVDASRNLQGWEAEFCDRLFTVLGRKGMNLIGDSPLRVERPDDLSDAMHDQDTSIAHVPAGPDTHLAVVSVRQDQGCELHGIGHPSIV